MSLVSLAGLLMLGSAPVQAKPPTQPYTWKSVQMVGGGFVDGVIFHPTARDVRYARTDMGGAYRWDPRGRKWSPILDWVGYEDVNLMGIESIAVDPADPNRVYLACGTYTNRTTPNGAILRSTNRGRTFQRTDMPFKMGGNENGRGNGERMAVDPNSGNVLFLGTRQAGLWKSADYGATWNQVTAFPAVPTGVGVISVKFDAASGARGKPSSVLFAAVSASGQDNLFRSQDGGATWQPVPGEPTQFRPTHTAMAADGTLFISYGTSPGPTPMRDGAVWKLDTHSGAWTDVTPEKPDTAKPFGYACVAVQKDNPSVVIASSFYRPGGEEIYRSTDAGRTWKALFGPPPGGGATYDYAIAPYVAQTAIHWLFDIEIDPENPNHALFTTGYGGYETFNLIDADKGLPTRWQVMSKGIEETVPLDLLSPTAGPAHLISAIGDYGGFVHWNLDKPSPEGNFDHPHFGNCTGVACGENAPNVVVRVGRGSRNGQGNIGYSLDGGKTWQPPATTPQPGSSLGRIAVSSDGAVWIWTPGRGAAYRTVDKGNTWTPCDGLPNGLRVIADRVNPRKFYALDLFAGNLFASEDAGVSFTTIPLQLSTGVPPRGGNRGDGRGGQDQVYATPGREGDLWIAAFEGLHHTTDPRKPFEHIADVQEVHAFGFGKAAPGSKDPALYLVGVVSGVRGVFRSDDFGSHWVRINDDQHQWGLILQITGDPRIYGRVYVGAHGRGVSYGDTGRR